MKYSALFLLILMVLTSCTQSDRVSKTDAWSQVQAHNQGDISLNYVPSEGFSYIDENGDLTGVTIELMRDFTSFVEAEYGVDLSLHFNPIENFSEFYGSVLHSQPGVFGVANVTITEERKNEITFSPGYLNNIAVLITRNEVDEIEKMSEITQSFSGLKGLAFQSTLHETRIVDIVELYLPNAEIDYAHSNAEIVDKVAEDNQYFAYVDVYNFHRAVERGAPLRRHEPGDVASEQFGVIMPLNSDWSDVLTQFFEHNGGYVHSESYHNILRKHLGDELAELLINQL